MKTSSVSRATSASRSADCQARTNFATIASSGKIIVSENISLDGVVQDPAGEEGFRRGDWFIRVGDKDREEWAKVALDEALRLMIDPVVLGSGERLTGETSDKVPLPLVANRIAGNGLGYLTYQVVRAA